MEHDGFAYVSVCVREARSCFNDIMGEKASNKHKDMEIARRSARGISGSKLLCCYFVTFF